MTQALRIGVFREGAFDAGAYAVAVLGAQAHLAGGRHHLVLHTFAAGALEGCVAGASPVDALLVFGPDAGDLAYLRGQGRPSVVCERVVEGCSYVAPDNPDLGKTAARHLLDLGHQTLAVALPGTPATMGSYHGARLAGFLDAARAAGHPVAEGDILFGEKAATGGEDVARRLLTRNTLPPALYVQNQSMLLGLLRVFQEAS